MTATYTRTIEEEFISANPRSRELFAKQQQLTPGGFTHFARGLWPFPLFIERNSGSHKWDVDGHEYVDYWLGHGAMLLGHSHPAVVQAITEALPNGFHAGGETEIAIEWAELVRKIVPSAEQVRFVSSGGEATQMCMRVARAWTGKDRIIKFEASFHGWHDQVTLGIAPPYDVPWSAGIPKNTASSVLLLPFNDLEAVRKALAANDDIAGIILEPGGSFDDTVPSDPAFLRGLRDLCDQHRVVLIFDEVVTGFRYAPGGVQEEFGVIPDLTALGKVVGGGLPAGAVVGKQTIMDVLAHKPDPEWMRYHIVPHPGTWNANPIVAASGVATLKLVATGEPTRRANEQTRKLVDSLNEVFQRKGVEGFAYGRGSVWKTCAGTPPACVSGDYSHVREEAAQLLGSWGANGDRLRKALLLEGADFMRTSGFMSAVHTDDDIARTALALDRALDRMHAEGVV
jgi:glutamate-1-semialdehyde 2,1-aminomutase